MHIDGCFYVRYTKKHMSLQFQTGIILTCMEHVHLRMELKVSGYIHNLVEIHVFTEPSSEKDGALCCFQYNVFAFDRLFCFLLWKNLLQDKLGGSCPSQFHRLVEAIEGKQPLTVQGDFLKVAFSLKIFFIYQCSMLQRCISLCPTGKW